MANKINFPKNYSNSAVQQVIDSCPLEVLIKAMLGYSKEEQRKIKSNLTLPKLEIVESSLSRASGINSNDIQNSIDFINDLAGQMYTGDVLSPDEMSTLLKEKAQEDDTDLSFSDILGYQQDDPQYTQHLNEYLQTHVFDHGFKELENFLDHPKTIVRVFTALSEMVRRNGLSTIENYLPLFQSGFLVSGLQLIVNGTDPETVNNMLTTRIKKLSYEYENLLEMIRDGILSIQSGDNPSVVQEKLMNRLV